MKFPCVAMATKAHHKMGDISSDTPDICVLRKEQDDCFVGEWLSGFGFVDVEFPKETTRPLTAEGVTYYKNMSIIWPGGWRAPLKDMNFWEEKRGDEGTK